MSVEEYLKWERDSEVRYEYVDFYAVPKDGIEVLEDGELRAMSGESPAHNRIAANIFTKIDAGVGDRPNTPINGKTRGLPAFTRQVNCLPFQTSA